jgi:hypothetical protein
MVEVLLVPLVVTELAVDELDEAALLAVEVALETVMTLEPVCENSRAGQTPAHSKARGRAAITPWVPVRP